MTVLFLVFALFSPVLATNLNLDSVSVLSGRHRIFDKSLTISPSDTLFIPPGSSLLFAPLTGLTVSGVLIAAGTSQAPVSFSSVNDSLGVASPFDWLGIELSETAFCSLSYTFLGFATSGITSPSSSNLRLYECIFSNNGQWHVNIDNKILQVPEKTPFSYGSVAPLSPPALVPASPAVPLAKPFKKITNKQLLLSSGAMAFLAAGVVASLSESAARSAYYDYRPGNPDYDGASASKRSRTFTALRDKVDTYDTAGKVSFSVSGLLAVCLFFSFRL
jgi:hypothetical protein